MKKVCILMFALIVSIGLIAQDRTPGPSKVGLRAPASTINVQELDGTIVTVNDLITEILGPGVTFSNPFFDGTIAPAVPASAGKFSNGFAAGLEVDNGIILSSGFVLNALGPNTSDGITGVLNTPNDPDLDLLVAGATLDRTVLQFDFVPDNNKIFIDYVFASDEYNEYVNSIFNDVFAFFVNGVNIALIPSTTIPVAINNVHNGNPYGIGTPSYPQFYNNNDLDDGGPFFDIEADGFTTKFRGEATVLPNETNTIKIAIADRGDQILDSWVFIKAGSFTTTPDDPTIPISNWALFIGIGLIIIFSVIRFRRIS